MYQIFDLLFEQYSQYQTFDIIFGDYGCCIWFIKRLVFKK